ncbi:hypothetical protein SAMN05216561_102120 [Nocardioides psychrotolerans]|uniref:Uncharacterized protein n=1 Tax=Nocardioides psychrotolerans TaxID=1005945 RepID=A0A1I3CLJ8_9ACTN|nr:hypothetical protein SAMN05216561_102120 [Nocardioides psychrotolerans]
MAAAVGVGTPAPAVAAGCSSASGVTVVVDFNQLGGGVASGCISGGGGQKASALFPSAGHPLTYAQRQPGFVCRVSGVPAEDPCVNTSAANAYWGLWWTDGKGGDWVYSSLGAASLTIPDGGYVGFSWDESGGDAKPSFTPAPHPAPSPTPTPTPTAQPSQPAPGGGSGSGGGQDADFGSTEGGQGSDGGPASSTPQPTEPVDAADDPASDPSGDPSPSATAAPGRPSPPGKPGASADPSASATPAASPSDEATGAPYSDDPVSPTAATTSDDGLPAWVAPALIVLVFASAGGVFLQRRRQTGP